MEDKFSAKAKWYKKGWGIALIVVGAIVLAALIFISALTANYYFQLKSGKGAELYTKLFGTSTPAVQTSPAAQLKRNELETADSQTLGNPKATLVAVEFVDFKCPNCLVEAPILKKIMQKYGYKFKVIVRHFPLETLHPGATELSKVAYCAGAQNKFFEMSDALFAQQSQLPVPLTETALSGLASLAGVDLAKLKICLADAKTNTVINRDFSTGAKYGVQGTPTFFFNGEKVEGAITAELWEAALSKI